MSRAANVVANIPGGRSVLSGLYRNRVRERVTYGLWQRPAYAYCIYQAGLMANALGITGITAVELGVAAGAGLLAMESHAREIGGCLGIDIDVVGFDGGCGMPEPTCYKDLPYVWANGDYRMDEAALRKRLTSARLVIGDVGKTFPEFARQLHRPLGFVSFDLDYYSSTKQAFDGFLGPSSTRLPRVYCYFDDVLWPERAMYSEFTGELAAIREFNDENQFLKIGQITNLILTRVCREVMGRADLCTPRFQSPALLQQCHPRYFRGPTDDLNCEDIMG